MSMKKTDCVLLMLLMLAILPEVGADSFFVCVQENGGDYSPAKEGLFNGLFEHDHIVFDDAQGRYIVPSAEADFKELIGLAARGGAEFLVAARVTSDLTNLSEEIVSIKSKAYYYFIDVKLGKLVAENELSRAVQGEKAEVDSDKLIYLLGEDLSREIDSIWKKQYNIQ